MLIVGLLSLWLIIEGLLIEEGVFTGDDPGYVLVVAGGVGLATSLVVMRSLVNGAIRRAAGFTLAQALTALVVAGVTLEHRGEPRDNSDEIRLLVLLAVLLLDAAIVVWAVGRLRAEEPAVSDG
jgi:hypothetical protein